MSPIRILTVAMLAAGSLLAEQTATQTVKGMTAAPGLEVKLWAAEPDLLNPTNIDIDSRGRIWVLEGVNYRRQLRGEKDYRSGDRIVILEDTNHDGKADKAKTFVQEAGLRSPLGIAVLGNKVVVSQSPGITVYTKDEDDRIVKKETLLTGWNGVDHDHGLHAVTFGPDGRYYFNSGDQGFDVTDKSGRRLASGKSGPYYAGCALRVNPDGTGFTVLGHNFRNPYELALDSFGSIWQTDNDDDGNAWVRVNYVMQGGNFGYWGPGARKWQEDKGSHFHSENPGVVPNIQRTGAGSPTGLVVYEGKLLPEKYRGQLLHSEAGKRLINTYLLSPDGAGYSLKIEDTVSAADTWFRPSDVAVGPDGAVYIADWYDASVGGHQMKDIGRGRIYRLAPAGYRPAPVRVDLATDAGLGDALRSPAQSVRYLAYERLKERGPGALSALLDMAGRGDPVLRARSLWLLGSIPGEGRRKVEEALRDPDSNFRIAAIRILQLNGADMVAVTRPLLQDPSPQVRREIAIALQDVRTQGALDSLIELCRQYDGKDRWYLEALGIAARGRENELFARMRAGAGTWDSKLGKLWWEFRPADARPYLIESIGNASFSVEQRGEALDALSAMAPLEAGSAVATLINTDRVPEELAARAFEHLSRRLFSDWTDLRRDPSVVSAIRKSLLNSRTQARALELADDLEDPQYGPELLAIAKSGAAEELRAAAVQALGRTRDPKYLPELDSLLRDGPVRLRVSAVRAIGYARPRGIDSEFEKLILSSAPNEVRSEAVRVLGRTEPGATKLLDLEQSGKLPAELRNVATGVVNNSRNPAIKARAGKLLPPLASKGRQPLSPTRKLLGEKGDARRGRQVFTSTTGPKCNSCHKLGEGKKSTGPDLSAIGGKLGKEALLDAILNPSAGIAPEYYVWILETRNQGEVIGILAEDTPQRVVVRNETGDEIRLKPSEIKSRRRSQLSMMPEDLVNHMTERQLVDLLEYLTTLKDTKIAQGSRP
ncbi:MAG TPA: PVC-type heme-binding CxxCH protein [Bryobacteraceae bacterium]|nr:PVC-type heme-binding CxxCH protein [Bryobacteraceae bacterium]